MYFYWFLAATAVLTCGIALKKRFFPAKKQILSPVQPSPTISDWQPAANLETQGENRISTWGDRRLFSEFRGILSDDTDPKNQIVPEDLPMHDGEMFFGSITPAVAQLLPESAARRATQRKNLMAAGYQSRASWINLTAIRFVLAFLSLVLIGYFLIVLPPAAELWLFAMLIIAPLMAWAIPPLVVSFKASERKVDIERGLPDVLDMMNMGVSQGLTVPQSLKRISREIGRVHPALAEELQLVNQQADVGSMPQALRNFSQRIDSPEVNSFTSLLIQCEVTGTSISRSLKEYSDSIRSSWKERADARANLASFQLQFPVAMLLMPSVFLILVGPAIVRFSEFYETQQGALFKRPTDAVDLLNQRQIRSTPNLGNPGLNPQ
ncbi:MAG: type II secretion system F family protein [Planctomycetota bacterium]